METHKVQKEVVTAHREQINDILKRQAAHRSQLQNIIGEHQLRINKHIEVIIGIFFIFLISVNIFSNVN